MSLSILLPHTRSVADGGRDIRPIKWRAKFGGMVASLISEMKDMAEENRRLKRMYAKVLTLRAASPLLCKGLSMRHWSFKTRSVHGLNLLQRNF